MKIKAKMIIDYYWILDKIFKYFFFFGLPPIED
jgi:hypothetical protein